MNCNTYSNDSISQYNTDYYSIGQISNMLGLNETFESYKNDLKDLIDNTRNVLQEVTTMDNTFNEFKLFFKNYINNMKTLYIKYNQNLYEINNNMLYTFIAVHVFYNHEISLITNQLKDQLESLKNKNIILNNSSQSTINNIENIINNCRAFITNHIVAW